MEVKALVGWSTALILAVLGMESDASVRHVIDSSACRTAVSNLQVGDILDVNLPGGERMTVELALTMPTKTDSRSFLGKIAGRADGYAATVTETGWGTSVVITADWLGKVFTVSIMDEKTVLREQFLRSVSCGCKELVSSAADGPASKKIRLSAAAALREEANEGPAIIDVLVAYDAAAVSYVRYSLGDSIENHAANAVARMNAVLANSGLSDVMVYRLAGTVSIQTKLGADLDTALQAVTEGRGDCAAVVAERDAADADVVVAMVDTETESGETGLAWGLARTDPAGVAAFASQAYGVVSVRAVAQSDVVSHEVGHLLGCGHASAVNADEIAPGPQSAPYSSGYYFTGTNGVAYHTVMGYAYDGYGGNYVGAPLFSTPNLRYMGGVAGDASHDNVRVLRENCVAVSRFRGVGTSYALNFSPVGGTAFESTLAVSLSAGVGAESIRYTIDGSTPTATYGTPYVGPILIAGETRLRAVAVVGGIAGPVYEAWYYPATLSYALNTPGRGWTKSSAVWKTVVDQTYDGVMAVAFVATEYSTKSGTLSTTVEGPCRMRFMYRATMFSSGYFRVNVDDRSTDVVSGARTEATWQQATLSIPSGSHTISFDYSAGGRDRNGTIGLWLDKVSFNVSEAPSMFPSTTMTASTAAMFDTIQEIVLTPVNAGGKIYYTLDGSDPAGTFGILYEKPLTISKTREVRAVEVDPGRDPSEEIQGLFVKKQPLGEWSYDVDSVLETAARYGRFAVVCVCRAGDCGWTGDFFLDGESKTFLSWARENGVYLGRADHDVDWDAFMKYHEMTEGRYIYGTRTWHEFASLLLFDPKDMTTPLAAVATEWGYDTSSPQYIGSVRYIHTVQSLIDGLASVMNGRGVPATPFVPVDPSCYFDVAGMVWQNDVKHPWREGRVKTQGVDASIQGAIYGGSYGSGESYVSELTATVSERGRLTFDYACDMWSGNVGAYYVDGVKVLDVGRTDRGTVTNVVTSSLGAVFKWQCSIANPDKDEHNMGGFRLMNLRWIPETLQATDAHDKTISVPGSWLERYYPYAGSAKYGELVLGKSACLGLSVAECYVVGLDPTDPAGKFEAMISFDKATGKPVVTYSPRLSAAESAKRQYRTYGKESLTDAAWTELPGALDGFNYFKVTVEMK